MSNKSNKKTNKALIFRFWLVKTIILAVFTALAFRLFQLGIGKAEFLNRQSQARSIRTIQTPAHRGRITDRNGQPLAVSTPVMSVWVNPALFNDSRQAINKLAEQLNTSTDYIKNKTVNAPENRRFEWLKRGLPPSRAKKVKQLAIDGVFLKREYRRFYPQGPITAQLTGFTDIDQHGQEGMELKFDDWLQGSPGKKRVVKDQLGHVVAPLKQIKAPQRGQELNLSIDYRIQYLAYHELKKAVKKYRADSASAVVLDPKTGEVLAMANAPSYNPNNRPKSRDGRYRNRVVTDQFEPGSTMKTFALAKALEDNVVKPDTVIDTNPGRMTVDGHKISDEHVNHGKITVKEVLQKSSNVGVSKIILRLSGQKMTDLLRRFGFGQQTQSGFPGENSGKLPTKAEWRDFELASLGFGYGIAVTPLQLAKAYAIIANNGDNVPVSLIKRDGKEQSRTVISEKWAHELTDMLVSVTEPGGTGRKASIEGFKTAGKTATSRIAGQQGYHRHSYIASFVGFLPADEPQLTIAVILRRPQSKVYFGGLTAAPVFANIARGALRILNIVPKPGRVES